MTLDCLLIRSALIAAACLGFAGAAACIVFIAERVL